MIDDPLQQDNVEEDKCNDYKYFHNVKGGEGAEAPSPICPMG